MTSLVLKMNEHDPNWVTQAFFLDPPKPSAAPATKLLQNMGQLPSDLNWG